MEKIENTVINGGYCVGCGVCTIHSNSPYKIIKTNYWQYQAVRISKEEDVETEEYVAKVCPFSNVSHNEDYLGKELFESNISSYNKMVGHYVGTYASYTIDDDYRERGSSGGLGSWILVELFKQKKINGVIHVKDSQQDNLLFEYTISRNIDDIKSGAKSKYYPVELSNVLQRVKEEDGVYAIVGIPCFIKAVRLLMKEDPVLGKRIKYCIGLVCGHLKSAHFASMLAWQVGIHPNEINWIDFRTKLKDQSADKYAMSASLAKNPSKEYIKSSPMKSLYGGNWGFGFFKYKSCDFCDDVLAEIADITIGDAWLPQYVSDTKGTNIVVVRNKELLGILKDAEKNKRIRLIDLSVNDVVKSQEGGFRHRREGLAYRLQKVNEKDEWYPKKRVQPGIVINKRTQRIQDLRTELREASHISFMKAIEANSFNLFVSEMSPLIDEYKSLYKPSLIQRVKSKIKRLIK